VNSAKYFRGDLSKWNGTKEQYTEAFKRYRSFRHKISRWEVPNNHLVAEVDIDNDGVPEPVYLDQMYTTPTLLLVLRPDYSDIDYDKTKLVMMHPSRKKARWKDVREISPEEEKKYPVLKKRTRIASADAINSLFMVSLSIEIQLTLTFVVLAILIFMKLWIRKQVAGIYL